MRIHFLVLVGLFFLITSFFAGKKDYAHPYHLSNFHINYNTKNNHYEIYIKCFTNDLERAVKNKLILNDSMNNDIVIDTYIYNHFKIDGVGLIPLLKDIGVEASSLYYYSDTLPPNQKKIDIFCDFLYNEFLEQTNIFSFNINKKAIHSRKVTNPQNRISFRL